MKEKCLPRYVVALFHHGRTSNRRALNTPQIVMLSYLSASLKAHTTTEPRNSEIAVGHQSPFHGGRPNLRTPLRVTCKKTPTDKPTAAIRKTVLMEFVP